MYLGMAQLAQREGMPEVAEVLKTIAWEEAEHAAQFPEINEFISPISKRIWDDARRGNHGQQLEKTAAKKALECDKTLPLISLMRAPGTRQAR